MKMSRTTLKELTKRYRAVLIKCAMLNAIACGVLYSGSVLADPMNIVINGTDTNTYSGDKYHGVDASETNRSLGNNVNSIKTSTTLTGTVRGIFASNNSVSATSISGGIDIKATGTSYDIGITSGSVDISNLGSIKIETSGSGAKAYGIFNSGSSTNTIGFASSSSSITAKATGTGDAPDAYGIYANGTGTTTISNLGKISVSSANGTAYGIFNGDSGILNVSFNGNGGQAITATGKEGSVYSIYADFYAKTAVNFTNSILSGIIYQGKSATLNLTFNNGGVWQVKSEDITGNVSLTMAGGTLDLLNGQLDTIKLGSGNLTVSSKSYLTLDVDGATGNLDTITTTGSVSVSGTLIVNEINLLSDSVGTTFESNVVSDEMKQIISGVNDIKAKSANYYYSVAYDSMTGKFTFTKGDPILQPVDIEEDVVKGVFSGTKSAVNSTNEAVKSSIRVRLAQLSGSPVQSTSSNNNVSKGQSGGDEDAKYGLWAQAIYSHVKRDQTGSSVGFKGHSEGIVIGGDAEVAENVIAGFAYAYTNSNMKSKGTKSDIDTHGFFAYGQYKPSEWFINGSVGFGLSKADPKGSDKDIKSKFYSVDVMSGYEMSTDFGNLTPAGGLRYVRIEQDSYREDGTTVDAKDANTLTAVAQIGWNNVYKVGNMEVKPKASIGFIYDLESENNKVTVSSAGAKFLTEDGRLKRFGTEVSAGVDTALTNNWNVSLDYTGEFRQHYENHTGTISVRYDF